MISLILITVQAIAMLDYGLSAYTITISSVTESLQGSNSKMIVQLNKNPTLDSRIDVAPWINVASGKFDKKNNCRPLKCVNLCSKV